MPHLISESGRAITAHHSLLLVNVIDVESQMRAGAAPAGPRTPHPLLREMAENLEGLTAERMDEAFHDALFAKERAQEYFASGVFTLRDKADAEQLYLCTLNAIQQLLGDDRASYPGNHRPHRRHAGRPLFLQLLGVPVAAGQLGHRPALSRSCRFTGSASGRPAAARCRTSPAIPTGSSTASPAGGRASPPSSCTPCEEGEPYILGIFLTGAYQEILGDLHNLFGDTNAVHVRLTDQGYEVTDLVHGDTVTEVLNYVQFHASDLLATFRRKVTAAQDLSRAEANAFIADYVAGLEGYTYLEGEKQAHPR